MQKKSTGKKMPGKPMMGEYTMPMHKMTGKPPKQCKGGKRGK